MVDRLSVYLWNGRLEVQTTVTIDSANVIEPISSEHIPSTVFGCHVLSGRKCPENDQRILFFSSLVYTLAK